MTEFSSLGLSAPTLEAVQRTGYTTATPIQEKAIPFVLAGRDVLGIAQTGTGKTAAFTLPMIDHLAAGRVRARMPRSLVVCPTRELADQVSLSFERYSFGQKLSWALLIGGVSFSDQEMKLDRGVDVLIATPGRLLDHFERGKLILTGVQIMVVDEADRMLDMGFIPDLERIFRMTPAAKQTLFFSATMPPEITRLTKQFLKDPVRVEAAPPATTAEHIAQHVVRVPSADHGVKRAALRALAARPEVKNGIVFCNRKSEVDIVARSLKKHGFDAAPIHGDLDQATRTRTLEAFRRSELRLLVASDVAARGLDIPDVSHIFNYDVPHHADDYVHRIGRTGRAGKSGEAYMLVTPADGRALDKVVRLIGLKPDEVRLEVDWAAAEQESRSRARPGRPARPSRPEREHGRGRGRPATETSVASMEALPEVPSTPGPAAPQPVATPERPKPQEARGKSRRRGRGRQERPSEPRAERSAEARPDARPPPTPEARPEPRAQRSREQPSENRGERPPERERGERPVRGFGGALPAFLRTGDGE